MPLFVDFRDDKIIVSKYVVNLIKRFKDNLSINDGLHRQKVDCFYAIINSMLIISLNINVIMIILTTLSPYIHRNWFQILRIHFCILCNCNSILILFSWTNFTAGCLSMANVKIFSNMLSIQIIRYFIQMKSY